LFSAIYKLYLTFYTPRLGGFLMPKLEIKKGPLALPKASGQIGNNTQSLKL